MQSRVTQLRRLTAPNSLLIVMPRGWRTTTTTTAFPASPPAAYSRRARLTTLSFIIREKTEEQRERARCLGRKRGKKRERHVRERDERSESERGAVRLAQWKERVNEESGGSRAGVGGGEEAGVGCSMNKRVRARRCRRIRMEAPNGGRSSRRGRG